MKIAVLGHLKFPIGPPFAGGLERHTHALVAGLRRRGHDVTLYAAAGSDPAIAAIEICPPTGPHTGEPEADAAIDRAEQAAYSDMMQFAVRGGFDLIHLNCLHDLPLRDAGRIAAPMVVALHVPPYEPFGTSLRTCATRVRVVAVSAPLADLWRRIAPHIEVIGNGVDLRAFSPDDRPRTLPYAAWSGRIAPEKGLHLAIDAARRAGIELAFAGPRTDASYWAEEIAPRLGEGVVDRGHLGEADLVAHVREASVFVATPCWEEPFGLTVIEALACGTPVAGFARGALPSLVETATGRLVRMGEAGELAGALIEASRLDRTACRTQAVRRFDIELMLDAWEALYRKACGPSNPTRTPAPGTGADRETISSSADSSDGRRGGGTDPNA